MVDRRYADKPVKPRGAVRQQANTPVKGNGRIRAWMARILGAAVLSTMVAGVVQLAITWSAKPVAHVSIEGEFTFIDREQVAGLVYEALDSSFVRLDLRKIQQHLQQQAWIDYAAVSRRWPDSLEVRIKEHQPIARWGALGVLNQRGEVILLSDSSELNGLPVLTGPDASSQKVMEQYQVLSQLLRKYGLEVKGLQADATLAWTLTLDNDLPIVIGRDQVMEKVGRFLVVYQQQLKQRLGEIERIDVRYSNGVAIGWKQVTDKSLTQYSVGGKQLHTA
ncbi:cell division protein FtsQ/DivIB [Maricurvus nonylphenolicus]|uniref:cell division protein FtsQ/DivIB n=1 Tax=Maricurvus nonylphenolicus TaxID=1008307 RepID=UPI0036F29EC6